MTQNIVLETARFTLRKIEAGELETLHGYWSDDIVTEYMNIRGEKIFPASLSGEAINKTGGGF